MIEMKDVVKKVWQRNDSSSRSDVHIEPGEFAYIVGPSGAGKSTFIRLLYREVKHDKGSLKVAGFDLDKIKTRYSDVASERWGSLPRLQIAS